MYSKKRQLLEQKCPDFPPELIEHYRSEGYWLNDTFDVSLKEMAKKYGDRPALTEGDVTISYAELSARVESLTHGYLQLGLQPGDVVVVQLPNSIRFVESLFALTRIGVVPVLALTAYRKLEIEQFCRFTGAKAYIIADQFGGFDFRKLAAELQAELPELAHVVVDGIPDSHQIGFNQLNVTPTDLPEAPTPHQVAVFQISGGTTGIPKLIPRRHQEYLHNMRCAAKASNIHSGSVYLCVLPIAHNFTFACPGIMATLLEGGHIIITNSPEPEHCFDLIQRHNVTVTSLVPPLAQVWVANAQPQKLQSLQVLQVGGAKLAEEAARRISPALGCTLQQVFGMAEGLVCFTQLDGSADHICKTQGYPMSPGDEVRVVDNEGNLVAPGEKGLIQVRGPYTMRGYFGMPDKNAESFTADGFYVSGDLVEQGEDGAITVVGRQKEQINRGGEKLSGEELENVLLGHDGVLDAVVVGLPDTLLGERICAFVIPKVEALSTLKLKRHLKEQGVAAFKMPDEFRFIERFPETGVGKVNKVVLRKKLSEEV
ncbi:(2,3-dihydroxybenzoyl)adenylate synthase [Vibrio penaeicida]|uniref:(2,3-dihydroxybenzoyl)adenylate synthase n=1 Tax=Vibrio penaeicida TaxID=104609 RepID=UPI000CEA0BC9|nr:AMP-binding protein [Vibrio penaeicida]